MVEAVKLSNEEKTLLVAALSIAMDATATQQLKWRYHSLRTKLERAQRSHLTLVKSDPPDDAA